MKLYLDLCALKRPFDDQSQARIARETQAVIAILDRIERGVDEFTWSTALTFENDADPDAESRTEIAKYAIRARSRQRATPQIEDRLRILCDSGLRSLDAAHVAFAESAGCDALITCDDRLIRQATEAGALIRVLNPIEYQHEVGHD